MAFSHQNGIVVPIHKKYGRQCLENYPPLSLLPVREMFPFFIKNDLILQNWPGFKLGDSC